MKVVFTLLALLLSVGLAPAKEKKPSPPAATGDKIYVLDPIKVKGSPIISFAIDITVYAEPGSRKIDRIFIKRVLPDTDAEKAGLQAGDEIVKLDGIAVKELDAIVSIESPLGKILLNRTPGEPLKLEVLTRRAQEFTLRAQRDLRLPR
jgi:membrane-associated protease RseP (regulator of RpoE activity)